MHHMNIHVKNIYPQSDFELRTGLWHNQPMNIASLRRQRGWSQIDLAEITGLSQPKISRAENGDDSSTMATFKVIAEALGAELHELFIEPRAAAEEEILKAFRALPEARQKGWLDMAHLAASSRHE
ncbi:helix-turn-helix domain-containing protein [Albirhodobacter sp. R86504]|uniref:helix-turn-helix domain-containing protein n=1 Tax=Albirhodobacter sp. R86504 TaxID=3093848 RepID=UPI0036725C30